MDVQSAAWLDRVREGIMRHDEPHWQVTVECDGKVILRIGHGDLGGLASFTERQEDAIRSAAENLVAFIGEKK